METPYSWQLDSNPSPSDHDDSSFIEMDPRLPPSKRFFRALSSDHFSFDFPASDESSPLEDIIDVSVVSISRHERHVQYCWPLNKCRMYSKRFLEKYVFKYLLRPFLYTRRPEEMNVRMRVKWEVSGASGSSRTSVAYSDNWRRSCDSESSSIYEAVLHCKRTQGK